MSDSNEDPKTGVALSDGPVRNPDIVLIRKEHDYLPAAYADF